MPLGLSLRFVHGTRSSHRLKCFNVHVRAGRRIQYDENQRIYQLQRSIQLIFVTASAAAVVIEILIAMRSGTSSAQNNEFAYFGRWNKYTFWVRVSGRCLYAFYWCSIDNATMSLYAFRMASARNKRNLNTAAFTRKCVHIQYTYIYIFWCIFYSRRSLCFFFPFLHLTKHWYVLYRDVHSISSKIFTYDKSMQIGGNSCKSVKHQNVLHNWALALPKYW